MGRLVALSPVKPEASRGDPEGTEREARALGRIGEHDNIASLYHYGTDSSRPVEYMVFEYLARGTLTEFLQESGPLPLSDLLRLGRQLSRGLSHLHGRGLIHRDVSPDNVWLDERRVAHLGDFDSAITSGSSDARRPLTTNAFAAAEERAGRAVDVRADLYSLGGVLYAAASGADRPGNLGLLRIKRPDLPTAFVDLLASLLAELPEERPPDAGSVLRQLQVVRRTSDLDALISAGESDNVERKGSLRHPLEPLPTFLKVPAAKKVEVDERQALREVQKGLQKAVTKTIAAFLNTSRRHAADRRGRLGRRARHRTRSPVLLEGRGPKRRRLAQGAETGDRQHARTRRRWHHSRLAGASRAGHGCRHRVPRPGDRDLASRRRRQRSLLRAVIQHHRPTERIQPHHIHPGALAWVSAPARIGFGHVGEIT